MIDTQQMAKMLEWLHALDVATIRQVIQVAEGVIEDKNGRPQKSIANHVKPTVLNDNSIMPFGKFRGQPLRNIDEGYLRWLYGNRPIKGCPPLEDYIKQRFYEE